MGGSAQPILPSLNNLYTRKKSTRKQGVSYASWIRRRHIKISKRSRRTPMKRIRRFSGLEGSRRPGNGVESKVKTLKKLVPGCNDAIGLDGVFRETADYILGLEMRVRVMQVMVKVLSTGVDDENKKY
ncbi:hypothetical protein DCAR_0206464 [Daucus carota subsp. sativus]|uniref:Uncharacterized protein n=1 Tax=Daucus carota subsp. sativus TaxID=79200 RepID=A0A161Y6A9_DAUCS|nr:PREDICTED: transcription factor UPBEAT1-like [Daucus carota subsp. sativus]WOG87241.1 hypothetical protein DCAR_0206464 [Daucus carota subsp. sativus]